MGKVGGGEGGRGGKKKVGMVGGRVGWLDCFEGVRGEEREGVWNNIEGNFRVTHSSRVLQVDEMERRI